MLATLSIYALERLLADSQTLVQDNLMRAVDMPNKIKPRNISLCNYPCDRHVIAIPEILTKQDTKVQHRYYVMT